jgi:hypothetical protein
MTVSEGTYLDTLALFQGGGEPLCAWLEQNLDRAKAALVARGGVLFRGFGARDDDTAERSLRLVGRELLDDAFWSTPRSGVSEKTFTATEYPKQRTIALHSEMAYMNAWPRLVAFHALVVAEKGGETTVCSVDRVSDDVADLLPLFRERGVTYRRTYHAGVDIPWQKAFRTTDRSAVEAVASRSGMTLRWLDGDVLQTSHTAQGTVAAEDGRPLWFSQAHVFHTAIVPEANLSAMIELFGKEKLPRNALYGDGTEIPDAVIRRVNETFDRHALGVAWQPGDVVFLDNMRFAHGRRPFTGARKLHVAMANQQTEPRRTPLFG